MTRTLALPELVDAPPADDPFFYGSRYVIRVRSDGTLYSENLPLTLWDVMHPQEGDHITKSKRHKVEVGYLTDVLRTRLLPDKTVLLLSDTAIYWDTPGLSHHCPDVAVIFGIRERKEDYTGFRVSQEAVRPELIIEVVSPHIREVDTESKFVEYHAARVPVYVIVDRLADDDPPTIRGYRWEQAGYSPIDLDENGRLRLPMLGLHLGARPDRVALYDATSSEEQPDYLTLVQRLAEAKLARREAEEQARLAGATGTPPA